jgi:DNA-binding response OmpR family regulator
MKRRILIAEDEPDARAGLVDVLASEGYAVDAAANGRDCIALFDQGGYDLALLDVMMPEKSGYDVCRHIRTRDRRIPIILLTAKSEEIDKVLGLELGADDYVTKPFGIRELLARIAAVLRRAELAEDKGRRRTASMPDAFQFGAARIDRKKYRAEIAGSQHALTARELALLEYFAQHPDEVLSRDELLDAVWGIDYMGTTRTLDQHIAQLRKKIELDSEKPETILTVHGVGYRYSPAEETD